jgi:hypothetical protein
MCHIDRGLDEGRRRVPIVTGDDRAVTGGIRRSMLTGRP